MIDYVFPFMIQQGLSTSTLASSFGKVITSMKNLTDYRPEDLASTLLSAFTYNIAQVSLCYIRLQVIELSYTYYSILELENAEIKENGHDWLSYFIAV
jgi:pantothenate kinase